VHYPQAWDLVLGLAAWRLGDSAALSKVVEGLASARPTDPEDNLLLIVERTLNALRLRDAGDPGAALASLKGAMVPVTLPNHWRDLYSQTIPRYLYAELLRESGRYREAIPWFASVNEGPHKGPGFPLYFPGLLRRAQCYEQLGEFEEAISAYTRFVELWRNGDPEVMPMVEEAQDRLDALVELRIGEPTS